MSKARKLPKIKKVSLSVRLPSDLLEFVKQRAAENQRTANGEIIFRLEQSIAPESSER